MLFHPQYLELVLFSTLKTYLGLFTTDVIPSPFARTTITNKLNIFFCLCEMDIYCRVRDSTAAGAQKP